MLTRSFVLQHSLLAAGLALFLLGAIGDIAYHALPGDVARQFEPLLGADAGRAHLVTLLGMLTVLAVMGWKGVRHTNHSR